MYRFYVERKASFDAEARRIKDEVREFLHLAAVQDVRYLLRYDVENVSEGVAKAAATRVFSEAQSDNVYDSMPPHEGYQAIIWEYLPGQYDQRADSAQQCLQLLRAGLADTVQVMSAPPIVRCAKIVLLAGEIDASGMEKVKHYLINDVDSRLTDDTLPKTLLMSAPKAERIPIIAGLITESDEALSRRREAMGLAMDDADFRFLRDYFKGTGRDPTETEVRLLDTYWSDHCRHTTFLTELANIKIEKGKYESVIRASLDEYQDIRRDVYKGRKDKCITLMDMAVIGAKELRAKGKLDDLEVSDENNACSVYIDVDTSDMTSSQGGEGQGEASGAAIIPPDDDKKRGGVQRWILMFKNETHNHPTEIEPFGGAATCIGGAIRDPLSGRAWVYQAMRVTGAADPTVPLAATAEAAQVAQWGSRPEFCPCSTDQGGKTSLAATLKGKLPQIKLCRESAQGFSSYGNQIGLATGQVSEYYHPGYAAKRMELGAVIAAAPAACVVRETPEAGDVVILLGGGTGRDGIGGATGSSKVHTAASVETCAAEVQKGNPVEERKIQRLFRDESVARMIRRANDFGAGGVAVAVGELAPGLDIDLDAVPKKYEGLNGTEIAISESQERMAVVVRSRDAEPFIEKAAKENLLAVVVARVTDTNRLVMKWRGDVIVDIDRGFLDAAGAHHEANAVIKSPADISPLTQPIILPLLRKLWGATASLDEGGIKKAWLANMADLACCSNRGLSERFDGSIGAGSVLFPYGGRYQRTSEAGMAARIPVPPPLATHTASIMTHGTAPRVGEWSPWHGAQIAVLSSLAKAVCLGGQASKCRLSFQEFFGRAVSDETWGYPAAALLGALDAQIKTGCPAIGGKDSMSGTFFPQADGSSPANGANGSGEAGESSGGGKRIGDAVSSGGKALALEAINVPHTLVSFAVVTEDERNIQSGSFKKAQDSVYLVSTPYSAQLSPDWAVFMQNSKTLYRMNKEGKIAAMYCIGAGGLAEAVTKMAMGNGIGIKITSLPLPSTWAEQSDAKIGNDAAILFVPQYGAIVVEAAGEWEHSDIDKLGATFIGKTTTSNVIEVDAQILGCAGEASALDGGEASRKEAGGARIKCTVAISDAVDAWEKTLSTVYPIVSGAASCAAVTVGSNKEDTLPPFAMQMHKSLAARKAAETVHSGVGGAFAFARAKPRVVIPVFPGTNCEYDTARAFINAGADVHTVVFTNRSATDVEDSLAALCREVGEAQILSLAGGFSAGDEPDGSGKFIANVLRSPLVAQKVMELLQKRDGLILGICNGFQALIKTGLVPFGEIRDMDASSPTLTFNRIARHVSRVVRTSVISAISPWAHDSTVLNARVHLVPVSHGEGRVALPLDMAKDLFSKGQVFSQYVDDEGKPTMAEPDNPNGSVCAIEGLTSADGRVLGKMGHSERTIGGGLLKNIPCREGESLIQDIFSSGVRYFV